MLTWLIQTRAFLLFSSFQLKKCYSLHAFILLSILINPAIWKKYSSNPGWFDQPLYNLIVPASPPFFRENCFFKKTFAQLQQVNWYGQVLHCGAKYYVATESEEYTKSRKLPFNFNLSTIFKNLRRQLCNKNSRPLPSKRSMIFIQPAPSCA